MVTLAPSYAPSDGGTSVAHAEQKLVLQPTLTLLVILLIPCVVLLFLLNCFLLFHRFPVFSLKKRGKRRSIPRNNYSCFRNNKVGHARLEKGGVTSSSKPISGSISQGLEAATALEEGIKESRNKPQSRDSDSPCPACMMSIPCCSSRRSWNPPACAMGRGQIKDDKVPSIDTGCSSELETRHNAVPPNTPAAATATGVTPKVKFCNKTSTQKKPQSGPLPYTPLDSIHFDHASSIPQEDTYAYLSTSSSLPGPGLDSDFGVSAGISLHILSSDSESSSQSWPSGMEWDYYDPCYMRRNRRRRQTQQIHHIPMMCSKQYWV
ncbi:protein huluwa-like [Discoglossus pictus]